MGFEQTITDVRLLIIGAGLGGIGAALELCRRNERDFVVVDSGPRVGGVWRDNQYPNAATDTPIELYAFEHDLGSAWSTNYAPWNEILAYLEDLVEKNDLSDHLQFNTTIDSLTWDDGESCWHVKAADGRQWHARFVVWAGGLLSEPLIPDLPGMDSFDGTVTHTARWSDDLDLEGRKVLVVGGGATSIQTVPYAAEHAAEVYALVRTPSYVRPKPEVFFSDSDRLRFANDPTSQLEERARLLEGFEELTRTRFPMDGERIKEQEKAWQQYFDSLITDRRLREILTPDYRYGCRRPLVSNSYYQAFQKPTVTGLGGSIVKVEPDGVVTSELGKIVVDTIIFATGFDAQGMLGTLEVRNGLGDSLNEAWREVPSAYLGTLVKGFPNLFLINGPNTGGPVVTGVIAGQAAYIADCVEWAGENCTVEVDPVIFDAYNQDVQERAKASVLVQGGCTSWYRTEGGTGKVFSHWPGTIESLRRALKEAPRSDLIIRDRSLLRSTSTSASLV